MIRFGTGFLGIVALILTVLIFYCIHFGIIMLLWKWLMVGIFNLPMITFGQTIGLWLLIQFFTHGIVFKPIIVKPKKIIKEDIVE